MKEKEKRYIYAAQILEKIQDLFDEEEGSIDRNELRSAENLKEFIYALGTIAPAHVSNKLTGRDDNHLSFNQMQNTLVFEYSQVED